MPIAPAVQAARSLCHPCMRAQLIPSTCYTPACCSACRVRLLPARVLLEPRVSPARGIDGAHIHARRTLERCKVRWLLTDHLTGAPRHHSVGMCAGRNSPPRLASRAHADAPCRTCHSAGELELIGERRAGRRYIVSRPAWRAGAPEAWVLSRDSALGPNSARPDRERRRAWRPSG